PDAGATGNPWPQPASSTSANRSIKTQLILFIWIVTHVLAEAASLQRNRVAVGDRRQRPVDEDVDRLGNELHRSVAHGHIKTTRVQASPAPFTNVVVGLDFHATRVVIRNRTGPQKCHRTLVRCV